MSNTPILSQLEESDAPWNDEYKTVPVTISISMSCTTEIEIPKKGDYNLLEEAKQQVNLPLLEGWYIDEFCVI